MLHQLANAFLDYYAVGGIMENYEQITMDFDIESKITNIITDDAACMISDFSPDTKIL